VAECLRGFVIIHEELSSFPEIFLPISSLLQEILDKSEVPGLLRDIFHEVIDLIKKRSQEHHASREPLRMRKKLPEPIKQLNPKFEEKYVFVGFDMSLYDICSLFCFDLMVRSVGLYNI
jgi:nucleolar protein 14